jgi:hypothetical protein
VVATRYSLLTIRLLSVQPEHAVDGAQLASGSAAGALGMIDARDHGHAFLFHVGFESIDGVFDGIVLVMVVSPSAIDVAPDLAPNQLAS